MASIHYEYNKVTGVYQPTAYPIKPYDKMEVPKIISKDFNHLTQLTEDKYMKEYLKVCAFYNKLFPSLKHYDWSRSTYNTVSFTVQDQERSDTGTGLSSNYLKSAIDLVVARLGNNTFDYSLVAEQPTVQYTVYKDEIERILKSFIRRNNLNRLAVECFHDAAILGFSHAFVDPWSGAIRKISDWEFSCYESEFSEGSLKRVMIRDFAFPVSGLGPYTEGFSKEKLKDIADHNSHVDLRLYIDCFTHKKYVAIGNSMAEGTDYPFDKVLLATLSWDLGVRKTTITSLFDLLYPVQRQINKLLAKKTQLLAMYKGPVPVFSGDADLVIKQLSNGAGEALFLDTQRKPGDFLTVMNPMPLDPELNAEMEALKSQIFELAGVQQISMDIENYRSAAAVVALDQMRDAGFQSQLTALANFIRDIVLCFVEYMAKAVEETAGSLPWKDVFCLVNEAYVDIKPTSKMDASGGAGAEPEAPDYMKRHIEQFIMDICKGNKTFDNLNYSYDYEKMKQQSALRLIELLALNGDREPCERLEQFLIQCFIRDVQRKAVELVMEEGEPLVEGALGGE